MGKKRQIKTLPIAEIVDVVLPDMPDNLPSVSKPDAIIAALKIAGKSLRETGAYLGKSKDAIAHALKKEDVRALVEYGQKREAIRVPATADKLDELLQSKDEAIALRVVEHTQKNTRIAPSPTKDGGTNIFLHIDNRRKIEAHLESVLLDYHRHAIMSPEIIQDTPLITSDNNTLDAERT